MIAGRLAGIYRTLFYFEKGVVFRSDEELATIIFRLRDLINLGAMEAPSRSDIVGRVNEDGAELWGRRAWKRGDFAPVFYGKFISDSGHVILKGYFAHTRYVRIGFPIWCFIAACTLCAGILPLPANEEALAAYGKLLVFSIGMIIFSLLYYSEQNDGIGTM